MKRLGKVLHLSSNKNLILKTSRPLKPQTTVLDNQLRPVGAIYDVFGPVADPYVAIKPTVKNPEQYVGRFLYLK